MKKALPLVLLVVLAIITLLLWQCNHQNGNIFSSAPEHKETTSQRGLNRNPALVKYSKHARCRMGCRHIDESEVKDILKNGRVNYAKSELKGSDCNKKYAVEGISRDNQKLRIIFAPCSDEVTVVTVIDIGKEWPCDCE